MTTLRTVSRKLPRYTMPVYVPAPKRETFEPFYEAPVESHMKVYGSILKKRMQIAEYLVAQGVALESAYDALFQKRTLLRPKERSKSIKESVSTLKPEITGLGLGGIVSFGLGIFALSTGNTGLATVMAGPFIASILGFALIFIGFRLKNNEMA